MAGIYAHIPFCASRCIYCGFYSTTGLLHEWQDRYVEAIVSEYRMRKDYLHDEAVRTVYVGGGTPSLLSSDNLRRLALALCAGQEGIEEFTIECNPDDITPSLCRTLVDAGVNRVSMGVQTFNDQYLRFLHRRHRAEQIAVAVEMLHDVGIDNISIDLMFGFPGETTEEWSADLRRALSLDVQHLSAYSLMYEEGTPLYHMLEEKRIKENDEERSVEMYDMLLDTLSAAGYEHYEISNFARQGFRSKHNSSYWNGTAYIGLGAAAHSYDGTSRQWNTSDLKEYVRSIERGTVPMEREMIDEWTRYNELIATSLRTSDGLRLIALNDTERRYIMKNAQTSLETGTLEIVDGALRLTRKGLYISDDVMAELVWV